VDKKLTEWYSQSWDNDYYLGDGNYFVRYLIVDNIVTEVAVAIISITVFDQKNKWVAKVCTTSNQFDVYTRFFSNDLDLLKMKVDIYLKQKGFKFKGLGY
jgi:hypothetical protein